MVKNIKMQDKRKDRKMIDKELRKVERYSYPMVYWFCGSYTPFYLDSFQHSLQFLTFYLQISLNRSNPQQDQVEAKFLIPTSISIVSVGSCLLSLLASFLEEPVSLQKCICFIALTWPSIYLSNLAICCQIFSANTLCFLACFTCKFTISGWVLNSLIIDILVAAGVSGFKVTISGNSKVLFQLFLSDQLFTSIFLTNLGQLKLLKCLCPLSVFLAFLFSLQKICILSQLWIINLVRTFLMNSLCLSINFYSYKLQRVRCGSP